jgi:hypothetical protein
MSWLSLIVPGMLLVHNVVDFSKIHVPKEYCPQLNCLISDYIEALEQCNNIRLVNITGTVDTPDFRIGLQFESSDYQTIDGARLWVVDLIDGVLKTLNSCPKLLGKDSCFRFTEKNIELRICFVDDCKYSYPSPEQIKYVSFMDNSITYSIGDPTNPRKELQTLRTESLEMARLFAKQFEKQHRKNLPKKGCGCN